MSTTTTHVWGTVYTVNDDKSLTIEAASGEDTIPYERMVEIKDMYKGSNRIHKPFGLLFWTDVLNGKSSQYTLI